MPNLRYAGVDYPTLYPTNPRLFGAEDATLVAAFTRFNLMFTFQPPTGPDGTEDKDLVFYAELDARVRQHLSDNHLCFPGPPGGSSTSSLTPIDPQPLAGNQWDAMQFQNFRWTPLAPGNKPRSGYARKVSVAGTAWYEINIGTLPKRWTSLSDHVNPGGVVYLIGKPSALLNNYSLLMPPGRRSQIRSSRGTSAGNDCPTPLFCTPFPACSRGAPGCRAGPVSQHLSFKPLI